MSEQRSEAEDGVRRGPSQRVLAIAGAVTGAVALAGAVVVSVASPPGVVVTASPGGATSDGTEGDAVTSPTSASASPAPSGSDVLPPEEATPAPEREPHEPAPGEVHPSESRTSYPSEEPTSGYTMSHPQPEPTMEPTSAEATDGEPGGTDHGAPLWGRKYVVVSATDDGRPIVLGPEPWTTYFVYRTDIEPPQRQVGWRWGGCNSMGSNVEVTADRLLIDGVGGTAAGCADAYHQRDAWSTRFFEADPSWRLDGKRLRLWSGGDVVELEEEVGEDHGAELRGRTFRSVSVTEDDRPRALVDGTRIKVVFDHDGGRSVVRWSSGCNLHGAPVEVSPDRLDVGSGGSSSAGCRPEQYRQDEWLWEFFRSDPFWKLEGSRLTLWNDRTTIVLEG